MQKRYIPIAMLVVVLLILLAHFSGRALAVPASFTYAEEKKIYLTFDDGPSSSVTPRVLDTLKEENVKATFFLVSEHMQGRQEVVKRIRDEGHTLGVHSVTHCYQSIYASDEALLKDIRLCAEAINRVAGVVPTVYRFPGGSFPHREKRALVESLGYRVIDWNAVCGDEEIKNADADTLVATSLKTAGGRRRVVLLLHDSAPHKATAEALPRIIREFRNQGYLFCAF